MRSTFARAEFAALGTTAVVAVTHRAALDGAVAAVRHEVELVDAACSRFRPDSELSVVNRAAGRAVAVSGLLVEALEVALRAARLTDGRVVPTVGGRMRVLGYDRDFASVPRAGAAVRVTVGPVLGWWTVELDPSAGTVKVPPGVELDLGATAKAWCSDRSAGAAADATGSGVLVSLGGDVAVSGDPPHGGWPVRVADDHAAPVDGPGQTVSVTAGGLATSGTTVRRWQRGQAVLHHVLDPATGRPVEATWETVTVAAGCCADANIASTAALVLGADAPGWLESRGLIARLVAADGTITTVGSWPAPDGDGPWS